MSPASSPRPSERDARDRVDDLVQEHQFSYSISQLRLVGLLLLLALGIRIVLALAFGLEGPPLQRLETLNALSLWLPLLPLAVSLCLLAGGRRRQRAELPLLDLLHFSLIPLGLACLVVLPVFSVHESVVLNSRRAALEVKQQAVLSRQLDLIAKAREATSGAEVARLSNQAGIPLPLQNNDSAEVALWRLEHAISTDNAQRLLQEPLLNVSPLQHPVLGLQAAISTALLSGLSGIALLLLHQQSRRQLRRHGLTPGQFFRSDTMGHGERAPAERRSGGERRLISRRRR